MGGRRDDSAPGAPVAAGRPPVPPPSRPGAAGSGASAAARPLPALDEPAGGRTVSPARALWGGVALGLAVLVTVAVVLTDDPVHLRVLLLAVCWAAVVAGLLLGKRSGDAGTAEGATGDREAELRHAYELELAREVSARHEYEAELEGRLRRESEQAMRAELAQLRGELAGLAEVREQLTSVGRLREDLSGLEQLRSEVAALGSLRQELSGLGRLQTELAALGELRADLGRMRTELTEQLSGELLIERMVMRAQSVRGPATEVSEQRVLAGEASGWQPMGPSTGVGWESVFPAPADPEPAAPGRPDADPVRHRLPEAPPAAMPSPPPPPRPTLRTGGADAPPPSPRRWLSERSLLAEPTGEPVPRRHRRAAEPDDDLPPVRRHRRAAADPEPDLARSTAPAAEPRDELGSWTSGPYATSAVGGPSWADAWSDPAPLSAPAEERVASWSPSPSPS
ncbi:DUF6779 domain-containing protein, partial [Modestobacter roseus]|uniref:DUF6779 domain-containing protein n=1 Tax=Modestobacter roseus TaxID=1181884 RepID=UPI001320CBB8